VLILLDSNRSGIKPGALQEAAPSDEDGAPGVGVLSFQSPVLEATLAGSGVAAEAR
jgi:hypothetical protein